MDHANDPSAGNSDGLGGAVLNDDTLDELLQRVVHLACETIDGAHAVSISVLNEGRYHTSNSTDSEARSIDEAQYEGDDGPCVEAMRTASQLQVRVVATEQSWPVFAERAEALGVAGVLSTPLLRAPGEAVGALNVYARDTDHFGERAMRTATLIGEHAAILVGNAVALFGAAQLNVQLRQAVASREVIGEAKGILMEREGCSRDEAFDILRRASQRENRKLRDLAEELVLRVEARKRGTSAR